MRRLWTLIVAFVTGIATGGGAVYILHAGQTIAPPANPLLTANRAEMLRLVPNFFEPCGAIVFEDAKTSSPHAKEGCVDQIKTSVWNQSQIRLNDDDVLDPRVRARWLQVVRGK
ncbi:hypothetical protein [Variovorax sp. YR216]|uniref:hypothetical protein n=1 Tax=Variovorax sp. YR216 TaxID=1882828 RepID=UPI00089829A3|nr:hypothetical protein [Variovorax sp. YR216]SEB26328.1 hypothetical protein SAMN05444680_13124 [Variovorax sp. YR216]